MPSKIVGKFAPSAVPNEPAGAESFIIRADGNFERNGIIEQDISPQRMESIKRQAASGSLGDLYELYEKMTTADARIGGIYSSVKSTMSGLPIKVIQADGVSESERRIAEDYRNLIEIALDGIDMHALTNELVDTYFKGVRVLQATYRVERFPFNKMIAVFDTIRPISPSNLSMETQVGHDRYGQLRVKRNDGTDIYLKSLDDRRIFVIEDGHSEGFYDTKGALRRCLGWWMIKVYAAIWWAQFVENYGEPTRVGTYGPEFTGAQKTAMSRFLQQVGRNKWGIFPEGANVQLMEANQQGSVTTYRDIISMSNNEIAVALVGQTGITTDSAQGSRAKLQVLDGVRQEIVENIAKIVAKGYSRLVDALLRVNYGDKYIPRLRPTVKPMVARPGTIKEKVDYFGALAATGFPVPVEEITDQTGIPIALEGQRALVNGKVIEWSAAVEKAEANATARNAKPVAPAEKETEDDAEEKSSNDKAE